MGLVNVEVHMGYYKACMEVILYHNNKCFSHVMLIVYYIGID